MRKNKKIVALLTLLMFAVVMVAPVAGNAAVTSADVAISGNTVSITNVETNDGVVDGIEVTDGTDSVPATVLYGTNTWTADVSSLLAVDNAGENITLTVKTANDVVLGEVVGVKTGVPATLTIQEPITEGDTQVTVNTTSLAPGDALRISVNGNYYAYAPQFVTPGKTTYTFSVPALNAGDVIDASARGWGNAVVVDANDVVDVTVQAAQAVADASRIEVKDDAVRTLEQATVEVQLRNAKGDVVDEAKDVYIWAEEVAGQASTALVDGDDNGIRTVSITKVADVELQFERPGTYKIFASLEKPTVDDAKKLTNVPIFKSTANTIVVRDTAADVKAINVDPDQDRTEQKLTNVQTYGNVAGQPDGNYKIYVDPNGTSQTKIDLYVLGENDKALEGIDVRLSTNSGAIQLDKTTLTSNYEGKVSVKVTGDVEGEYTIYAKAGGVTVNIPVQVQPLRADDIVKVDEPNRPLAEYEDADGEMSFRILDPNDQVIFEALENAGVLGVDGIRNQLEGKDADVAGPFNIDRDGDFVKLTTPKDSDLEVRDINFEAKGNGVYEVGFDKDLVKGDYTLKITLDNGRNVEFKWTVQPFGTAKELVLDYGTTTLELGATTKAPKIYFIDENGVQMNAENYVDLGASGYAVDSFNTNTGVVTAENDEKYLGDQIKVYAVAQREGLTAEATLTITSGQGSLEFGSNRGEIDTNNVVPFTIVDEEGNTIVPGKNARIESATVIVTDQSNGDAKIVGNVPRYAYNDILEKGKGVLNLTSDAISTADVKVTLVVRELDSVTGNAIDTEVYAGTLNYNFGTDEAYDGRVVVMTIGSNDVVVNNDTVTIDAAPFVNDDWRTMVPFRALAESFGAQVDWDGDAQTVTATLDGVEVVMTVGEETYTVNGVEKTADTAPVIVDDRTLVPVRFVAEAFGFDVLAIYDEVAGATASVLFTK